MIINGNKTQNLFNTLEAFPFFTKEAVVQITKKDPKYVNILLHRWANAGEIVRLKRGIYTTKDFVDKNISSMGFLESISSIIYPMSYVSLEYVLSKHGILTEGTFSVTSITTKKTLTIKTKLAVFDYKNISKYLFKGYEFKTFEGITYGEANLAKALFDYLYLKKVPLNKGMNLAEELRLNLFVMTSEDIKLFKSYVKESKSKKMLKILENLEHYTWQNN